MSRTNLQNVDYNGWPLCTFITPPTGVFVILTDRSALLCCLHTGCFRLEVLDSGVRIVCCLPLVTAATHSWAADKQYSYRQQVWSEQERPIAY